MRNTHKHIRLIALLSFCAVFMLGLHSCKKETGEAPDFYYTYFPTEIGHYVEYEVDSMYHSAVSDTFHYQVRELITEEFLDNEGRLSQRIERYKRADSNASWYLSDIWYSTRTSTRAEKVEEDLRLVKFLFPPIRNDKWDGNLYNAVDEEEYKNIEVHEAGSYGGFSFDSTVFILQNDRQNLVDTIYKTEVYATNVGLVEKTYRDLFYVWDTLGNIQVNGSELYQTIIGYGPQ